MFTLLLFLTACHPQIKQNDIYDIEINNYKNKDKAKISAYIDHFQIAKLESSDSSLIGESQKIIKYKGKYYLSFDYKTLAVFSQTGKFLFKIENFGRGPYEYTQLTDFDVYDDKIAILDPQKIIYFNLSGQPIEYKKLPFNALNFIHTPDHRILFIVAKKDNLIYLTDENCKIISKQLEPNKSNRIKNITPFNQTKNSILFQIGMSNSYLSYKYKDQKFEYFSLLNHSHILTPKQEERLRKKNNHSASDFDEYLISTSYNQTQEQTLFSYTLKDDYYWAIYNNSTNNGYHLYTNNLIDDLSFTNCSFLQLGSYFRTDDSFFYAEIWPQKIKDGLEKYLQNYPEDHTKEQITQMQKILQSVDDIDNANPFIIEFNFK